MKKLNLSLINPYSHFPLKLTFALFWLEIFSLFSVLNNKEYNYLHLYSDSNSTYLSIYNLSIIYTFNINLSH